jgi:hypothetical protein
MELEDPFDVAKSRWRSREDHGPFLEAPALALVHLDEVPGMPQLRGARLQLAVQVFQLDHRHQHLFGRFRRTYRKLCYP